MIFRALYSGSTSPRKVIIFYNWNSPRYHIRKSKNYFKVISKSMMAAQSAKNKLLAEIFCFFECLLTQNPTNQDS